MLMETECHIDTPNRVHGTRRNRAPDTIHDAFHPIMPQPIPIMP